MKNRFQLHSIINNKPHISEPFYIHDSFLDGYEDGGERFMKLLRKYFVVTREEENFRYKVENGLLTQ